MNAETFNKHLTYMQNLTVETLTAKAKEYADDSDRLHNFKIAGPLQTRTPIGALGGFMAKHTISIYDMIRGTDNGVNFPMDMWEEKVKDHINYLFLLWGLVNERDEITEALGVAVDVLQEKAAQCAKPVEEPEAPKPKHAGGRPKSAKLAPPPEPRKPGMTINPEFEAVVAEMEAAHKAKTKAPVEEGLGELDDAKLRRKTQAALINYFAKHGDGTMRPLIRATGNRVNEETLQTMLTDSQAFKTRHWAAVDAALKKLALAEIHQEAQ